MDTPAIATLIKNFNVTLVTVLAFLAAYGIIVIIGGKSWRGIFRVKSFFPAFCAVSLAAFALEATAFNFQYYLKWFAGPELYTMDIVPDNPNLIRTSDGGAAEITAEMQNGVKSTGIKFKNLNKKVTSIFVDLKCDYDAKTVMEVQWRDEEGNPCKFTKRLYMGLPHENYTVIQPRGKVSELTAAFTGAGGVKISQVALNRQIPFYFSGLRLLAVSLFLFAVLSFVNKNLRAKIAYYLFKYKFNPANRKQNLAYAGVVILLVLFSWVCVYTSLPKDGFFSTPPHQMYNRYLVDALIAGRTYLDYGNPEKMLEWERPYDHNWRIANHRINVDWIWEWCYYNGKYYSHYGVVPAVILYVPYKLVTGNYLSNHGGIFIFSALAVIFLAMLWRFCVKKYMPDSKFAFYLLSFLTLFFASGLHGVLIFTRFYTIVQAAALMFAAAGVLLLLKSVENESVNRLKLFFACLCLALIVGCRPNMIFVSLLVPVVLWKHRSWKLLLLVMIPYIIVAIPLCWYNYARFGSISDFGRLYTLTDINHPSLALLNPIGKIVRTITCSMNYLFLPNKYSFAFPFVECFPRPANSVSLGVYNPLESCTGIINFPIVFTLFYLFKNILDKNRPKTFNSLLASLVIAVIIITGMSYIIQSSSRYIADFAPFIILPSLFCAYYWCGAAAGIGGGGGQNELLYKARMKVIYVLLAVSIFVGLCLFITGGLNYMEFRNPTLYRYLEYSLGFVRDV